MTTAPLGFTVHLAATRADLLEACAVRAAAYAHHVPEWGERFASPDATDHAEGTAILIARDKRSGRGIGTLRIQSNAFGTLPIEHSVALPAWLQQQPRAEITRLAVRAGAEARVKLGLMKASYLYCHASQQRWIVIGARSQALVRDYQRLGFGDVLGAEQQVPLAHAGNLPHRILALDVVGAERSWHARRHPLYAFMVETVHPDLQLFQRRSGIAQGEDALLAA